MHLSSIWSRRDTEKVDITFDIGSSSIGCSVSSVKKDGKIHIHYSSRVALIFQSHLRYDRFIKEMLRGLTEISEKVSKFITSSHINFHVGTVSCGLSSVWHVSKTHFLSFQRKESFVVTPRFIEKMLERTEDHAKMEKGKLWQNKHIKEPSLIDKKLLSVDLNGYRTANPYGKKARRINLSLHLAFMSTSVKNNICEILDNYFRNIEVVFYTRALSTYTVVRDSYSKSDRFLLINISGEVSNLTLVIKDVIQESIPFPMGILTLARLISERRNSTPLEALSLIRMSTEKNSHLNKTSDEYKLIQEVGKKWSDELDLALGKFISTSPLPKHIYVTAPSNTSHWFKFLLEPYLNGSSENEQDYHIVTVLTAEMMREFFSFDQKTAPDSALLLQLIHLSLVNKVL